MKKYKVKVPFIGYHTIEVQIDNDNEFDSLEEIEEAALELAKDEIWDKLNCHRLKRLDFYKYVEGSNSYRFTDVQIEQSIEEIIEDYANEETTD